MKRLFEYNPYTGTRTYFEASGKYAQDWTFTHEFDDVAPEVDASKTLQNDADHWKKGVKNGLVHYAHVPDSLLLKWHIEGVNINDQKELIKMVNKREYRYLKCTEKVHLG